MTAYELNQTLRSIEEMRDLTMGVINALASLDPAARKAVQAAFEKKTGDKTEWFDIVQRNYTYLSDYKAFLEDLARSIKIEWPKA